MRNESSLVTSALAYLKIQQNRGIIVLVERMNSGTVFGGKKFIRLHTAGTPDIFFVANNLDGDCYWIEAKREGQKQNINQVRFMLKIKDLSRHRYYIITKVDDLFPLMQTIETQRKANGLD